MDTINSKKNIIWNMIGTTFNAFNSLFFMMIVTRVNGLKDSGIFTLAFSLACLFCVIGGYEGRVFQVTDVKGEYSDLEYIIHRVITSAVMMLLVISYCIFMKYDTYKTWITILLCFMKCLEYVSDVFYGIFQKNDSLYLVGQSYFFKSLFSLILFISVDLITHNLLLSCISLDVVWILLLILFDLKKLKLHIKESHTFDIKNIILLFKTGFFSFTILFLSIYLVNAQKYALDGLVSEDLQAIFGIILMPATIISLAVQYLLQPILNSMARFYDQGMKREFNGLVLKATLLIFVFGIVCLIGAFLLGVPILSLLYGIDISSYKTLLMLIIAGGILYSFSTLLSAALTTIRYTFIQFIVFSITSIFTFFFSRILIQSLSIYGASLAYLVTMIFQFSLYIGIYLIILRRVHFKESL